jgi:hypothetical protein
MTNPTHDLDMAITTMHFVISQKLGLEVPARLVEAMRHVDQKRAQEAATAAVLRFCDAVCVTKH